MATPKAEVVRDIEEWMARAGVAPSQVHLEVTSDPLYYPQRQTALNELRPLRRTGLLQATTQTAQDAIDIGDHFRRLGVDVRLGAPTDVSPFVCAFYPREVADKAMLARRSLKRVELTNFTVFDHQAIECVPGVNVVLGVNSTGKTHFLKAAYCGLHWLEGKAISAPSLPPWRDYFRPANDELAHLITHGSGAASASVQLDTASNHMKFAFGSASRPDESELEIGDPLVRPTLYLPSHELLALYERFISLYEAREVSFDRTYYDACLALSRSPLKGPDQRQANELQTMLFDILGGNPVLEGSRFYLERGDHKTEAHLMAEGHRKLAALSQLLLNGSLLPDTILFWDEPETNLNPGLVRVVVQFLLRLADSGTQIFVATHDYLLMHHLSLLSEYRATGATPVRFHFFSPDKAGNTEVTSGSTLSDLPPNPIVEAFAQHYEFERALFQGDRSEDKSERP